MEKENTKTTGNVGDAGAAKAGATFCGCRPSCCCSIGTGEMDSKFKDLCEGMPKCDDMFKMMKTFIQNKKENE